jgi:hypothetical protein
MLPYEDTTLTPKPHMHAQEIVLGVLAGWWVGVACILVCVIAGGLSIEVRTANPMLPKLLTGFFFPVAIL